MQLADVSIDQVAADADRDIEAVRAYLAANPAHLDNLSSHEDVVSAVQANVAAPTEAAVPPGAAPAGT